MHLEVMAFKEVISPQSASLGIGPFITFREDEALGMQVVVHLDLNDEAFSLAELKSAIAAAESDVYKESHHD